MTKEELLHEYLKLAHAMQTGVAMEMHHRPEIVEPKHLRVGINSALSDNRAIATLLMKKGIITEEEYFEALRDAMRLEVAEHEKRLSKLLGGADIKLV